jgi:hypothetical protein
MSDSVLTIWTVYKSPSDHPGKWVLRGHDVPGGPRRSYMSFDSLEQARAAVPIGLIRMTRDPSDDAAIYESWI